MPPLFPNTGLVMNSCSSFLTGKNKTQVLNNNDEIALALKKNKGGPSPIGPFESVVICPLPSSSVYIQ